ncbi:MAG TPA: M28 family metallopeptidase [Isosphaeraceae bacterium]|jgi:N-acetylated-alpha-linked acidic dipeptidase|nr:M28 family metallopeptidase [Isosphaeraceae bacterium]
MRPAAIFSVLLLSQLTQARAADPPRLLGFAPDARAAELDAEARALAVPTPEKARSWLRTLTEEPHVAGTPADRKTAEFVRDKLKSWGWDAQIAEYEVLLNYPVKAFVHLDLTRPKAKSLSIIEDPHPADKDSASPDAFPAFNGYGISGDVTGQVVYANYGRPEDFKALEDMGVSVEGKIVLVRYGGLFRGLKVYNAQKRKAIGILIYSDPADDGFARGDTYPHGPFRPPSALQRGSIQFLSHGPGDPSTPEGPSIKGCKRLPWNPTHGFAVDRLTEDQIQPTMNSIQFGMFRNPRLKVSEGTLDRSAWEKESGLRRDEYFATIPALPISYSAARPILEALGGPNVPNGWQGGLPLAYHVGPGPAEVHFTIQMDYDVRPIWNVMATLKGEVEPDRWVMIGNHRDAWVYGAVDPGSGTASTLEACRALGEAVKHGWKPRRTLMYCSWDAEEYGLVGSTEWAEHHAKEVDEKAVLMLNVDVAVSGPNPSLGIDGVPSLRDLVLDAAGAVHDPRSGRSLRDAWVARQRSQWAGSAPIDLDDHPWHDADAKPNGKKAPFSPQLGPLGSGSDYTAFLDRFGVPCLDAGFHGGYGVYHSIYDDFFWMEKFGDPEFITHATAAKLYTVIAMRAAGAEVVPLTFVPYGEALRDYVDDLRRTVERKARAASSGKPPIEFEGLTKLIASIRRFQDRAAAVDAATAALARKDGVASSKLSKVNDALSRVERAFLHPAGLPARPFFRHTIYAPGLTTGYASWPLPGVRQAILDDDPKLLAEQLPRLVERIDAASEALRAAKEAAE